MRNKRWNSSEYFDFFYRVIVNIADNDNDNDSIKEVEIFRRIPSLIPRFCILNVKSKMSLFGLSFVLFMIKLSGKNGF